MTPLNVLAAVSAKAYPVLSSCLSWWALYFVVLAFAPYFGRLPCRRLFGSSVLLLGRFVPAVICGVFKMALLVDCRPSVIEVGLVVVLAVGLIVVLTWCDFLRSVFWSSSFRHLYIYFIILIGRFVPAFLRGA